MEFDRSETLLLKESKGMMGNKFCFYRADVDLDFPVHDGFGDRVLDGGLLALEADGIPFQAHDLLPFSIRDRPPSPLGTPMLCFSFSSEDFFRSPNRKDAKNLLARKLRG